jgi:hypothetical protein
VLQDWGSKGTNYHLGPKLEKMMQRQRERMRETQVTDTTTLSAQQKIKKVTFACVLLLDPHRGSTVACVKKIGSENYFIKCYNQCLLLTTMINYVVHTTFLYRYKCTVKLLMYIKFY